MTADPELMTVAEVAALLRTTTDAIYARVERGNAPAGLYRDGRKILFRAVDLRRSLGLLSTTEPNSAAPKKVA